MEFGSKLRTLRIAAGLAQRELARAAGVSVSYVSDVEHSRRLVPTLPRVALMCERLGGSAEIDLMPIAIAERFGDEELAILARWL